MSDELTRPDLNSDQWIEIENGLMMWEEVKGDGPAVPSGAKVKVHYTGWLTDDKATVFDSSRSRGQTISFSLNGVITGWKQGIPGLKPGGIRYLKIPGNMAYGAAGIPGVIPPNATLVFEVELVK